MRTNSCIKAHSPIWGIIIATKLHDYGAHLQFVLAENWAYLLEFKHIPLVAQKVECTHILSFVDETRVVVMQPRAVSKTVKWYVRQPLWVLFDRGYA